MRIWLSLALVSALVAPASALADEPPVSEIDELVTALDDTIAALDTSDCAVACRALASMIRSADRICEIDPGPPCAEARAKVEAARQKVLAACPDCTAAAAGAKEKTPRRDEDKAPAPGSQPVEENERITGARESAVDAPPAEDKGGGCASCALVGHAPIGGGWWLLAGAGLFAARRRRFR